MTRTILKWIGNIMTGFLVLLIFLALFTMIQGKRNPTYIPSIVGYKLLSVLTGSMRPVLEPGDMIVIKEINPEDIKEKDVITYRMNKDTLVTHRVVEIINEDGNLLFRTKGDANNTEDFELIKSEQIIGTLSFNIPKGGYISNFAKSPKGFVLFILVPIILLIAYELKSILLELGKDEKDNKDNPNPKDNMGV
ncbi:signal peptidase I [Anaeromicrobium sediminis]|uniref:Signal peptidase I n=1 Tax=Anaeromicrobium sediminis TaxID=1478221 RepID=A0A267MK49_9FIRM|nr:signal peptidase I [Anaeromicrobium sediminis]PAB59971.1 signal peptidase I [Anaeromicrobium sediminis]